MAEPKKPEEIISEKFEALKTTLETSFNGLASKAKEDALVETKALLEKSKVDPVLTKEGLTDLQTKLDEIAKKADDTVKGFDEFQKKYAAGGPAQQESVLTLGDAVAKQLKAMGIEDLGTAGHKIAKIEDVMVAQNGCIKIPLGKVMLMDQKDMTTATTLTSGNPERTYNNRQGIIPAQKLNIRDLMNTVYSPTGTYSTYTENSGETNNIGTQTEGSTKGQNEYAMTEKVNTQNYIAGFSVFTKQLLRNLPFLQGTLPRLLLRDFYKQENSIFYTALSSAATGPTSMGVSPNDVLQLINLIGGFLNTDYTPSWIVVNPLLMARLISSTYQNGYYPGAGSVILNGADNMAPLNIFGVPIFSATWVPANKALLVDMDYLERVETEGLSLAFSYEDSTNFRQNKITARVECQESLNLMLGNAACLADLGAS